MKSNVRIMCYFKKKAILNHLFKWKKERKNVSQKINERKTTK